MFGRRSTEADPLNSAAKRFWTWFGSEAEGISNAFEALARGEADADGALDGLNARIRRLESSLEADVVRTLDGQCHMTISGNDRAVDVLIAAAPRLAGWCFTPRAVLTDTRRVPFRLAPRPAPLARSARRADLRPARSLRLSVAALTRPRRRCNSCGHGCPEQDLHPHR